MPLAKFNPEYLCLLLPGLMAGVSVFIFRAWWRFLVRARAARHWPSTLGIVAKTSIQGGGGPGRRSGTYHPSVEYHYEVAGVMHRSTQVRLNQLHSSNRARSEKIVARYPVMSEVTVYYDPADPKIAVIQNDLRIDDYFLFFMGCFFLFVGVVGGVGAYFGVQGRM